MLNKAILMGRLTRDPELRYTQSNIPVVSFTVAVDRNYRSRNEQQTSTDFINCVAWRSTAEFISKWFTKGKMIVVVGSIQTRSYQDRDGNNRYATEVVADEVMFGESKRDEAGSGRFADAQQGGSPYGQQPSFGGASSGAYSSGLPESGFDEISDDDEELPF